MAAPTIVIDQGDAAAVAAGGTLQLTATTSDPEGDAVTTAWATSNSAVATVSSAGLVSWVSAGTATITATATDAGGLTATDSIAVTAHPAPPATPTITAPAEGATAYAGDLLRWS